jgi:dTDP-4-amino-4,6-dideoxygalactose transaminase
MRKIELFKVYMSPQATELVNDTLLSGFVGQGERVEEFEGMLRDWFQCNYVNTLNSATSGLHLALHLVNKHDPDTTRDEVLTTPLTCTATNWPILANNLKIRWVDVSPETCNLDLDDLERKLSPKTKAIMIVHWGGLACDLNRLKKIQDHAEDLYGYRPPIIEDCAHAWGATYNDKLLGTHGNMSIFSFQAIKHLTTGDGGCMLCPSPDLHNEAKLLRWYGLDRTSSADFRCEQNIRNWGFKFHMNDINASIGIANLRLSAATVRRHQANGKFYNDKLKDVSGINLIKQPKNTESSYWIYTMRVADRQNFVRKMKDSGIMVSQVHDRNDKHECVAQYRTPLPSLDVISKDMICIPCGWWVTDEDRQYVVDTIKKGW